jgi:hypothetical protein
MTGGAAVWGRHGQLVLVVITAPLVVPPATAIVMTAVPFMPALVVSSMLLPPVRAFAPGPTHSPVTSVRPDGSQNQQNQQSSHLKPYLSSIRSAVPALAVVRTVADVTSVLHVGCQQADGLCARTGDTDLRRTNPLRMKADECRQEGETTHEHYRD